MNDPNATKPAIEPGAQKGERAERVEFTGLVHSVLCDHKSTTVTIGPSPASVRELRVFHDLELLDYQMGFNISSLLIQAYITQREVRVKFDGWGISSATFV